MKQYKSLLDEWVDAERDPTPENRQRLERLVLSGQVCLLGCAKREWLEHGVQKVVPLRLFGHIVVGTAKKIDLVFKRGRYGQREELIIPEDGYQAIKDGLLYRPENPFLSFGECANLAHVKICQTSADEIRPHLHKAAFWRLDSYKYRLTAEINNWVADNGMAKFEIEFDPFSPCFSLWSKDGNLITFEPVRKVYVASALEQGEDYAVNLIKD